MSTLAYYTTGTVSIGVESTALTGSGTSWLTAGFQPGDKLLLRGQVIRIASINSNTSITLANPWPAHAGAQSGANYAIEYLVSGSRVTATANQVLQALGVNGNLTSIASLSTSANQLAYFTGVGTSALTPLTPFARTLLDDANAAAARTTLELGTGATATVTTGSGDVTTGRVLRVGDLGVRTPLNMLPDSGTFRGIRREMRSNDNTFSPGRFFASFNGSTFANGGDFINDNSTFGGPNGPLNTAVQDLLAAMGRSGNTARYGTTFSILQITAGSGTAVPRVGPDGVTRYMATGMSPRPAVVSWGDRHTWAMWARVVSGSAHTIGQQVFINETAEGTSALIPGTWSRIVAHRTTNGYGYYTDDWALHAAPGSVIELACVGLFFDFVQPRFWNAPLASATSQVHFVGTVGQSGGVPTDALMERGSNANGRYVRYADGTQICTHTVSASLAIDTAFMGGFRSAAQTWTYPAAFAAAPQLSITPQNLTAFGGVSASAPGTSSAQWAVTSVLTQTAATRDVALTAIGRWF